MGAHPIRRVGSAKGFARLDRTGLSTLVAAILWASGVSGAWADVSSPEPVFRLPTDNTALFEEGGEARFYAPTPGRAWTAGSFGCVRSEGGQMHEGIDILALTRDRHGEPLDEVRAAAAGNVVYTARNAALSNYGIYVVVGHRIEGLEVYTLYAHLSRIHPTLHAGTPVRAGQPLGILGRTANTRTPIAKDRAHLHFEINLFVNDAFSDFLRVHNPQARDDHGPWNGRNLIGLDPTSVFLEQRRLGSRFSLLSHVREQREMCRVLVAATDFPWLRRYPLLIRRNPGAEAEGIVGYEAVLNYNGLPFLLIPRARSEIDGPLRHRLLGVNEEEFLRHACRRMVFRKGRTWILTARGEEWLRLLIHR